MAVKLLGIPYPIHIIGESHTLIFRNLLFRTARSEQLFQTSTRYLPNVLAQNFYHAEANAHNLDLMEALRFEGLLRADLQAAHYALDGATISGAWMERRAVLAPPVVLFNGDLDLHHLLRQFADYDFELPGDQLYGVDHTKRPIAYQVVRSQLENLMQPFILGVQRLRNAGFARLMVHCLPPRTPDDAASARWMPTHKSVRAKMTLIANDILRRLCAQTGIGYIDIWPETCKDGYLLPQYDIDGTHLSREAALISLEKITDYLHDTTWNTHNTARYHHAAGTAQMVDPALPRAPSHQQAPGLSSGQLDAAAVAGLGVARASYAAGGNRLARMDWVALPMDGRAGLLTAQPSAAQLELAAQLLAQGDGHAILHGASERALTISSFRPTLLERGAAPVTLPAPRDAIGACKAILRLRGEGAVMLSAADGSGQYLAPGAAGTLTVYDPQRYVCQLDAAAGEIEFIEMALIPRHKDHPLRVVWADLNEWPADPFQYDVTGMLAWPPYPDDSVSVRAITMV